MSTPIFSNFNFGEGEWGGPSPAAPSGPVNTALSNPYLVATPVDSIPLTFEIPSGLNIQITWDFTRLLAATETISGFAVTPSSSLITVIATASGSKTVSAYLGNTMQNGQTVSVLCNFTGSLTTQNGRYVTFNAYNNGASIVI